MELQKEEFDVKDFLLKNNLLHKFLIESGKDNLPLEFEIPRFPIIILTCMDPRIDVNKIFQLKTGDIIILRNAGNTFSLDVLRGLLAAIYKYKIQYIIILGHLNCGMAKLDVKSLYDFYFDKRFPKLGIIGKDASENDLTGFFKIFENEADNIMKQLEILQNNELIPENIRIFGMLYDPSTGFIFDYDEINTLNNASDFEDAYKSLLSNKNQQYNDFIQQYKPIENQEEKKEIIATNKESRDLKRTLYPSLKIHIPKIKVYIPNIYKRSKEENSKK